MKATLALVFLALGAGGVAGEGPVVIAHRGASGYLPEHTLPAKALAHAMGADFIEQDIVLSKDGVPVVLHEIEIDTVTDVARRFPDRRRANGRYYAIDFTLAELKRLCVTERIDRKTGQPVFPGRFPPWRSTFAISTLAEELEFIQGLNRSTGRRVGIYPEIKVPRWHRQQERDISAIVLPILARHGYRTKTDPFFLQCFEFAEVKRLRTEFGFAGRLVQLIGRFDDGEAIRDNSALLTPAGLAEVARYADGIGPACTLLASAGTDGHPQINDSVRRAHDRNLLVHPYTFRADSLPGFATSPDDFFELFFQRAGVDGLFADHPDLAVTFLRRTGRR